jgi:hypothetical protein
MLEIIRQVLETRPGGRLSFQFLKKGIDGQGIVEKGHGLGVIIDPGKVFHGGEELHVSGFLGRHGAMGDKNRNATKAEV